MNTDPTAETTPPVADLDFIELFRVQAGQHAAVRDVLLPAVDDCDELACREANSHRDTCRCRCQGEGHGVRFRALQATAATALQARRDYDRSGFTTAMLAAVDDDAF